MDSIKILLVKARCEHHPQLQEFKQKKKPKTIFDARTFCGWGIVFETIKLQIRDHNNQWSDSYARIEFAHNRLTIKTAKLWGVKLLCVPEVNSTSS